MSKATTLPTKLGGSKNRWLLNKIKLSWEQNIVLHCPDKGTDCLFILFPGLTSLPNQLLDQQYHFIECMLSGDGCFAIFCTYAYCLETKKEPNKHISPI